MEQLLSNIRTFWNSAEIIYKNKDYTSATILYFKCLFALIDLIIYKKLKITPKDHTERFQILKDELHNYYSILERIYSIYRSTYTTNISKENCEEVKKNVIRIAKEQGIQLNN